MRACLYWLVAAGIAGLMVLSQDSAPSADPPKPKPKPDEKATADQPKEKGKVEEDASTVKLGRKIENFTLSDGLGKTLALYDLKSNKAVVLFFISFECPVSNAYRPTMIQLHNDYSKKGIAFIGICPTETTPAELAKLVKEHTIPFPVFKDDKLTASNAVAAEITPEAFVLDEGMIVRYRGRVDNTWARRLKKDIKFKTDDLKDALEDMLAGKRVSIPATQAVGCPIIRPSDLKAEKNAPVTYHRDILPLLQKHCQSCHRPGGSGPFSLMTYKQAARWSADIKKFVQDKQMPPWQASAGVPFANEMKMDKKEIDTITTWVNVGSPEGDPKDAPAPAAFTDGWQLGKPDVILEVSADFVLAASGADDMARVFPLKDARYQNKRLAAVEILPSNKRIVRSAAVYLSSGGGGKKSEEGSARYRGKEGAVDTGPGYGSLSGPGFVPAGLVGTYEPGQAPRRFPPKSGYLLSGGKSAGSLVLQVHYHRSGKVEKDRTKVGLYFAKESDNLAYQGLVMTANPTTIPAGVSSHRFAGKLSLDQDCEVHSVMPCLSFLGKKIKVTMTPPGGTEQTLVAVDAWDPHWQQTYYLKEPIKAKAGTRFAVDANFDNSISNVHNPFRPPRPMRLGHGVSDEQCTVLLGTTSAKPIFGSLVLSDGSTTQPGGKPPKGKPGKP